MTIAEEYQAEREKLELNRALDWSTFSKEYIAVGEVLEPMTVQNWFDLLAIKSPIIYNDTPTMESVVDYVWRHSHRNTNSKWLKRWRLHWLQKRIVKSLRNKSEGRALVHVICEHLKSSLDEYPSDSGGSNSRRSNTMSPVAGEASMIDEIAGRYAMHPEDVLKLPIRRAFALQRTIRLSTIPGYKILEADSLRAIKSKHLNNLNNGRK